ncbi:MAG TPA: DUF4258 domain-containing protein [Syntrophomonadaceae bacterium]|nr:DUF4258 domain-containing protein [Syntrophomonadaceae bacterium]
MNPRQIIKESAIRESYDLTDHCLTEMDKDGISIDQIEDVMKNGTCVKVNRRLNRYTIKKKGIMICVEINCNQWVTVVTAGRERR